MKNVVYKKEKQILKRRYDMFDYTNLKKEIKTKYGNEEAFAKAVNRPLSYVEEVLENKVDLELAEIEKWMQALKLNITDVACYFFMKRGNE